jgi:membrane-associated protein
LEFESIMLIVKEYGYIALYFVLWLGFFGLPVPNEVIVMTSGFITSKSLFQPLPAFIVTFAGVMSSLTTLYCLGRFSYHSIHPRLMKNQRMKIYVEKSEVLISKYGPVALSFGYFFPGVRHLIPFMVGSYKMNFSKFALFAYGTGFIWCLVLFTSGYYFGNHIEVIGEILYKGGVIGTVVVVLFISAIVFFKKRRAKRTTHNNA